MTTPRTLTVNGARLWDTILASAKIGPGRTPTGLRRLALTDADREMRDLFARWCREAGCSVTVDRMGNMFARRPGTDESLPPVLVGSTERIERELGWRPRYSDIETIVRTAWAWHRRHPDGYAS